MGEFVSKRREDNIKRIEKLRDYNYDLNEKIEDILLNRGASPEDEGHDEGLYWTMSNIDISLALSDIEALIMAERDPKVYYKWLKTQDRLNEYESGFVDGYEAAFGQGYWR